MVSRTLLVAAVVSALLACAWTPGAAAGRVTAHLGVERGAVSIRTGRAVHVGGELRVVVTVTDARGTGDGWTLRAKGATVSSISASCAPGSTCTLPRPCAIDGEAVLHAGHGTGMGVITLTISLRGTPAFRVA